jgi:hypothetical protein
MNTEGVRHRQPPASAPAQTVETTPTTPPQHPGGLIKHGTWMQAARMALFALYFNGCCIAYVYSRS